MELDDLQFVIIRKRRYKYQRPDQSQHLDQALVLDFLWNFAAVRQGRTHPYYNVLAQDLRAIVRGYHDPEIDTSYNANVSVRTRPLPAAPAHHEHRPQTTAIRPVSWPAVKALYK